ncbi:MAG: hypothetical protein FWD87_01000 [Spirochaetaceae bacterium]|nr:hypothetical protein [Spirochaetaceae bacterium]
MLKAGPKEAILNSPAAEQAPAMPAARLVLHSRGQRRQGEYKSQSACSRCPSSPLRSRSTYLVTFRLVSAGGLTLLSEA